MTPGSGAEKLANYFVGQIVGEMNQVKPTRRVVLELVEEFIVVAYADDVYHRAVAVGRFDVANALAAAALRAVALPARAGVFRF